MAYLSDNLPSFAVVVGEEGDVVNGKSLRNSIVSMDKRLIAFDNIFKQITSGINVLKQRRVEDFDEAMCWRRAKEFETRIKRQNFELKQKIHLFRSKGAKIDSMHCNQALRIGRSILMSYIHYLPLSSNKLAPDGILYTLDLLCSLFEKFNCGESLIENIKTIRNMLLSTENVDIPKNDETKKLIADLARLKFGKKAPNPIKNVKINTTLQKRIQLSHSLRHGNSPKKGSVAIKKNVESTKSPPSPPILPIFRSSQSSDDASVKNLLSRLADLESGIENIMASSNSLSYLAPSAVTHSNLYEKEETPVDISDDSLKEIQSYWAPATQVSEFIQVELCINRILDSILLELSEEMTSPTLIFDILKRELL